MEQQYDSLQTHHYEGDQFDRADYDDRRVTFESPQARPPPTPYGARDTPTSEPATPLPQTPDLNHRPPQTPVYHQNPPQTPEYRQNPPQTPDHRPTSEPRCYSPPQPPQSPVGPQYPLKGSMPEERTQGRRDQPPVQATGVHDCLAWQQAEKSKCVQSIEDKPYHHKFFIKKADIGKPRDMGYRIPTPKARKARDDGGGNAGDALRGWPDSNKDAPAPKAGQPDGKPEERLGDREGNKNMSNILAHKYIEGDGKDTPAGKQRPPMSEDDQQIIDGIAKRPPKVRPAPPKVEVKQAKQFDNTIHGRRAWRS